MKLFLPILLATACLAIPQNAQAGVEDLVERAAQADFSPAENSVLESRADIEERARCVPGSFGKKKKSCTSKCKGKGKCSRASSPGIGFVWVCTCP